MRGGRKLFSVGVLLVRFCPPDAVLPPPLWRSLEGLTGQKFKLNFAIFLGEDDLNSDKKRRTLRIPSRPLYSQFFSR